VDIGGKATQNILNDQWFQMCKISDKIKLCSCKTKNVDRLKHYWVLNRPEKKDIEMLGSIIPPADIGEKIEKFNITTLRKQLNDGNCFDIELSHQENDVLELHFTCTPKLDSGKTDSDFGNYLVYAFVFKKGKWKKTSYDHFGNNLSEVQAGKILTPFISQPNARSASPPERNDTL
jgi:hypothetical protein